MKLKFYILLFLSLGSFQMNAQFNIDSIVVKYTKHLTRDSSDVLKIYAEDLKLEAQQIIELDKVFEIALKKDSLISPARTTVELVYYQHHNEYVWMLRSNLIIPLNNKNRKKNFKIKDRYIWINQIGKITWYRKERHYAYSVKL